MRWFSRRFLMLGWILLVFLTGCSGLSLAADVTPPPDYTPQVPPSSEQAIASQSSVFPLVPSDPAQGEAIYAEKCLPCHGEKGMGDGPQALDLPNPPPPVGSLEVARTARPADWYAIVTSGRLDRFMPGFSESLTDRQRWNVVAYVLSMSISPDLVEQGKAVFISRCAECHGEDGKGMGTVTDLTRQDLLANRSLDDLISVMKNGKGSMSPVAGLTDEEMTQVAMYLRALSFTALPQTEISQPGSSTTPSTSSSESSSDLPLSAVVVKGTVKNANDEAMPGVPVTLFVYNGMQVALEKSTTSGADGAYQFEEIPYQPEQIYIAQAAYGGTTFNSEVVHGTQVQGNEITLPITIFETTSDPSFIKVERLHIFFDFSIPGKVQVAELYILSNTGDKVVVPSSPEQPALRFPLPNGAAGLQFDEGEIGSRYVALDSGFGDLTPVAPGQGTHQVLFSYELPYERKTSVALTMPFDVTAAVVLLPQSGVKLQSKQLSPMGQRNVQDMTFEMFTAGNLKAGSTIEIQLSGKPGAGTANSTGWISLVVGAVAFGLAMIGTGYWVLRQRRSVQQDHSDAETPETEEGLVDAIIALDDLYQAGKLPEKAYQKRRMELKKRLETIRGTKKE